MDQWFKFFDEKLHREMLAQKNAIGHMIEMRDLEIMKLKIRCSDLENMFKILQENKEN